MKNLLKLFSFLPFVNRLYYRKYYATGVGIYLINSFNKRILGICLKGNFLLNYTSRVNSPRNIEIKEGANNETVYLSIASSGGCYYQAINGIEFGEGTIWSNNCSFISANHSFNDFNSHLRDDKIIIGKFVWLGSNCVVLPGVTIGDYSIIGAGSIVTKSILPYSIVAGNPTRMIAKRCEICLEKVTLNEPICNKCNL